MGSHTHDRPGAGPRYSSDQGSRFGRLARRRSVSAAVLAMVVAIAAVGHGWAGTAAAQDAPAAPDAALPYRDLAAGADPIRVGDPAPMRRVVTVAFFTYDCASCQGLENDLADWELALPSGARLVRMPAVYDRLSRLHAQAFFVAAKLGKLEELHPALYAAVQRDPQRLDSVDALAALFASFGIERDAFAAAFDSLEVQIELDRAASQTGHYAVTAAPALVVGSRYLTTPVIAGSNEAMLSAARERVAAIRRGCREARCGDVPF